MPIADPDASPATTPSAIAPVALMTVAAMQALSPTFAPIERSSPPARITSVTPEPIRNVRLACRKTFSRLAVVRNASLEKARATHNTNTPATRYASAARSADTA